MTALAVSMEPAPFPMKVSSPAMSVTTVTAFRVPSTRRGWFRGRIRG